jgi:serine/threonine-protein kinase ULK/ATG1
MDKPQVMSIAYTLLYASPQILKREQYSSKCDVWSVGVLLYEMLYGKVPFFA